MKVANVKCLECGRKTDVVIEITATKCACGAGLYDLEGQIDALQGRIRQLEHVGRGVLKSAKISKGLKLPPSVESIKALRFAITGK